MQAQAQSASDKELMQSLNRFELGFLFGKLKNIKGINSLVNGVYGQNLLADISIQHRKQAAKDQTLAFATTPKLACDAFREFAQIKRDFEEKYLQLERKDPSIAKNAQRKTVAIAESFLYAMEKNKITYKKYTSDLAVSLIKKESDCDTSAILFIQFGREKGLDLIGVDAPSHYFAALRENGKVSLHIETTSILAGGGLPADLKSNLMSLEQLLVEIEALKKEAMLISVEEGKDILNNLDLLGNLTRSVRKSLYENRRLFFGVFSTAEWKKEFPDSSYSYDEEINLRQTILHETMVLDHLQSVQNYMKGLHPLAYQNRADYRKVHDEIKKAWEADQSNFSIFLFYFTLLELSSMGLPLLAVDNERELFSLYKKGLEIFGKKKLLEENISIPKSKIMLNPIDYYNSLKD